jgi:hypothetical protein
MKKRFRAAWCVVVVSLLSGCVGIAPELQTASGKAETTIEGVEPQQIKAAIVSELLNDGYTVEGDSSFSLVLTRPLKGSAENFAAGMILGNGGEMSRTATFTVAPTTTGAVRVVVSLALRRQGIGGQMKTSTLDDTQNVRAVFQDFLNTIKTKLETKPVAKP